MNILVIDDNKVIRNVVSAIIIENGHTPIHADGHLEALTQLDKNESNIDLVLMDIEMPEMNGFELTQKIRNIYSEWIPIIFLSSNDSESYLAKGIDAGGDDYLTKPIKQVILSAKIRAMERIALMKDDLDKANKQLEILSYIDPLTQVLNRRGLKEQLGSAWQNNIKERSELSLLMIDIDFFKPYNDNYGHPKGDECIKKVASLLKSSLNRTNDIIARYGGEEFVIVLPSTSIDSARFKAKELINIFAKEKIEHEYSEAASHLTVSIGVSSTAFEVNNPLGLLKYADLALYKAKHNGRNNYALYESTLVS